MKKLLIILSITPLVFSATTENYYSYRISESSNITISGTTNVNTFECLWSGNVLQGSLVASIDKFNDEIKFENAALLIDIKRFDCENQIMSNDMHKAMGADEHPNIEIKLLKAKTIDNTQISANSGELKVDVVITINGVQKETSLNVNWISADNIYYWFSGSKSLNMSDFDIEPPSRVLRMIRVRDMINIEFSLVLQTQLISQS